MKQMTPKELEKRLSKAYEAGQFDGYHQGIDDTHDIWVNLIDKVPGIGPKRKAAILTFMTEEIERRVVAKGMPKNELSKEVVAYAEESEES